MKWKIEQLFRWNIVFSVNVIASTFWVTSMSRNQSNLRDKPSDAILALALFGRRYFNCHLPNKFTHRRNEYIYWRSIFRWIILFNAECYDKIKATRFIGNSIMLLPHQRIHSLGTQAGYVLPFFRFSVSFYFTPVLIVSVENFQTFIRLYDSFGMVSSSLLNTRP